MKGIKRCLNWMIDHPNKSITDGERRFRFNGDRFQYYDSDGDWMHWGVSSIVFDKEYKIYIKPIDWSNVEVDTPILVRLNGEWAKRHFSAYCEGEIRAFDNGRTSFTSTGTTFWNEAKLAD